MSSGRRRPWPAGGSRGTQLAASVRHCYLDGGAEAAAEAAEDAEAVVQAEELLVLAEEVPQLDALPLQLLPAAREGAHARGGVLEHTHASDVTRTPAAARLVCVCFSATCRKASSCCSSSASFWMFSSNEITRDFREVRSASSVSTETLQEWRQMLRRGRGIRAKHDGS